MGKAQEIRAFTQEIRDFTMQRYQRHGADSSPTAKQGAAADSLVIHNSAQADSTFLPFALDSSSTRISSLKGGRGGLNWQAHPPYPPLFFHSFCPQAPDDAFKVARKRATIDCMDSASAEYMDCRALPSDKARNDDENAQKSPQVDSRINAKNTSEPAKDSRIFTQNAPILNTPQAEANLDSSKSQSDSKILDEKCGLQGKSQGSYLSGNDCRDFSPLPHLSSKAESPQAQKPTPNAKQPKDSRILEIESGFFKDSQGRALGVRNRRESAEIADSSPKAESTSKKPTPKPRKALYIDKEALSSLALVQEGLLAPISSLANSKTLHLDSYLTPFVLNPAGKRNRKVLESTKPNDVLDIVFEQKKVGYLRVKEVFPIDRHARTIQLTGLQGGAEFDRIYSRLGDLAVCGEYQVDFPDIKEAKARLQEQITAHNAKHITGLVLDGQIFHKAHEALIRDALSTSDLVVLFLLKPYRHTIIHYDMQKECVELAMREYLMSDRICTIPLDDTYLFTGTNNVLLHAMVARNYGCTHFIVSDNTPNLSVFYERNTLYSVLDVVSGISTSIKGGYVYCDVCQMLVNRTTCPHGKHHHISYDTESILEFFKAGLLPPSVLVRPSISARLIAHLFPNRFSNLQKLYYDLMPLNDGVLVPKSEEDFYLKLMQLYAIHSK